MTDFDIGGTGRVERDSDPDVEMVEFFVANFDELDPNDPDRNAVWSSRVFNKKYKAEIARMATRIAAASRLSDKRNEITTVMRANDDLPLAKSRDIQFALVRRVVDSK